MFLWERQGLVKCVFQFVFKFVITLFYSGKHHMILYELGLGLSVHAGSKAVYSRDMFKNDLPQK